MAVEIELGTSQSMIRINEISSKGTSNICNNNDWIELYNVGETAIDLETHGLHDSKGYHDEDAFFFPPGTTIQPHSYLLLCNEQNNDPLSPQFGIGGDDTITLTRSSDNTNSNASTNTSTNTNTSSSVPTLSSNQNSVVFRQAATTYIVLSEVTLPGAENIFDVSYAYDSSTNTWNFTSTPTPGADNSITKVLPLEVRNALFKRALIEQNQLGTAFFNMDDRGLPVKNGFDTVLYLSFQMEENDYAYMIQNTHYELYRPFQSMKFTTTKGDVIASLNTAGRIRPKGQSSLFMAICVGTETFPFQVELPDKETFYGMERFYLRSHLADFSYMRDYAYHRMLARFGLPHLRARKVQVKINGNNHGFYTLMEAPDQDYVFHRSFPDFDPQRYALYKVKSMAIDCGSYSSEEIALAETRLKNDTSTPPYAFERGEHKPDVPRFSLFDIGDCQDAYDINMWNRDYNDTVLAWLRNDRSCGDMLMNTGLIDRDLGTKHFDDDMKDFIAQDFSDERVCDVGCQNSDLADYVDQENWLKAFAFYAVTMNSDSPLVNGNNYYLAQSGAEAHGGEGGWKIVPYDFNVAEVYDCHDELCNNRLVHWSIARPTCTSLESNNLAGPILLKETLHKRYLEYVEEFVETIYANKSFIEELERHASEQGSYVRADDWSLFGALYIFEETPTSATWDHEIRGIPVLQYPLLPTMRARTEDVRAQLAAIKKREYPRGPFVGKNGNNEPWEPCADWRIPDVDSSKCLHGCKYEGCHMPGWTVESYCDEETGKCLHGDYDEQCRGVFDNYRYVGMEDAKDGRKTFCRFTSGVPVKAMECPLDGDEIPGKGVRGYGLSSSVITTVTLKATMALALVVMALAV